MGTGPAPADLVYLHTDPIGLPQKITDSTQAIVWDRVQDPFGRQVSLTNSGGIDTALRFPGQQADPDTGFAYNYFRDYDPTLGRYIQADPIGLAGGINRYAYVGGNPLTRGDPTGLVPNPAELACVAGPNPVCIAGAFADAVTTVVPIIAAIVGVGALSMSGDTEDSRTSAQSTPDVCTANDPNDSCFERWEREDTACSRWVNLGARWVNACKERAATRRDLCIRNGGRPHPDEPPQWSPFRDYPR